MIMKNFIGQEEQVKPRVRMLPGSWEQLLSDESIKGIVDVIIMSETLYNEEYYQSLFDFIGYVSKPLSAN